MLLPIFRLLALCLFLAPAAWAGNVTLVLSENGGPYAEFGSTFRDSLEGTVWKATTQTGNDPPAVSTPRPDLIIAVGSSAFRQVLSQTASTPVIATLIPRQAYEKLLAETPSRNRRITAIYLDQPPARQAAFLRQLLPGKKRVGLLVSQETQGIVGQFRQSFASAGLTLDSEDSDTDKTLLPALNALLPRVNVLLALPDTSIYRRDNIKAILVTSYRHQRPVVAFSAAFVNAGALAALYSTPAQIARQAAELTGSFTSTLPPPMPPSQFAVAINQTVAQALDLNVPDESTIRRAMLADKEAR
jgi:ABC-type uncharacterized transport system substrate-binding protein